MYAQQSNSNQQSVPQDSKDIEATDASQAAPDVALLQGYLQKLNSYQANFQQQRYSVGRKLLDTSSGQFVLKRPNHFIWQTYAPFEQQIISDGQSMWTVDVDLEQIIINDIDENLENAPIFLLARDEVDLTTLFNVERQQTEEAEIFVLTPIDASGNFERIRLGFKDQIFDSLELYDSLGQLTLITMTNKRNNPVLGTGMFQYQPNQEYDIIDSRKQVEETQ